MGENRTEKIAAMLTPSLHQELAAYAEAHDWTVSTAASNLIRQALEDVRRSYVSDMIEVSRSDVVAVLYAAGEHIGDTGHRPFDRLAAQVGGIK